MISPGSTQPATPAPQADQSGHKLPGAFSDTVVAGLSRALRKQWKRYWRELKRCQRKFTAKAIHGSRVETRRLLSTIELLTGLLSARRLEKARLALQEHLDALDKLRDTQTQLLAVGKMLRSFPAARPFHTYLHRRERRLTKAARRSVNRIRSHRLRRLIAACRARAKEQLQARPPGQALALLLRSVDRAFTQTRRRRARIRPEDARSIHRTRVVFKKFRYMVEALAEYSPGVTKARLTAMRHYQTMMGEIQDAEVLLRTLDKFLRKHEIKPDAARRFREELLRRRQWLIRVYLAAADQLLQFWPPPHSRADVRLGPRDLLNH